jgi:hypothetical protein
MAIGPPDPAGAARLYLVERYSCGATHVGAQEPAEHRGLSEVTHRPRSLDGVPAGRGVNGKKGSDEARYGADP